MQKIDTNEQKLPITENVGIESSKKMQEMTKIFGNAKQKLQEIEGTLNGLNHFIDHEITSDDSVTESRYTPGTSIIF